MPTENDPKKYTPPPGPTGPPDRQGYVPKPISPPVPQPKPGSGGSGEAPGPGMPGSGAVVATGDLLATATRELGLAESHVLAARIQAGGKVVVVTNGGSKLVWPDDIEAAKKLTDRQKDGVPQDTPHHNMTAKALAARKAAEK